MMTDSIKPRKKFTNEDIISAITFLEEVGKLSDEELSKRDLQIGEAQKVNHFLSAVNCKETTCLPKQLKTLLRLTPLLIKGGSNTVHCVILGAMPRALEAYKKATDMKEKKSLAEAIKTAAMVCVSPRLASTSRENRERELQMIEPFIGKTPEYHRAKVRFTKRWIPGARLSAEATSSPPNATRLLKIHIHLNYYD